MARFIKTGLMVPVAAATLPTAAWAQTYGADSQNNTLIVVYAAFVVAFLVFYCIPTVVAFWRKHPNRWVIMVINVAFGGTVIGWLGALVWAMKVTHLSPSGSDGGESGLNIFVNDPVTVRLAEDPPRAGGKRRSPQDPRTSEPRFEPSYPATGTSRAEPSWQDNAAANVPVDQSRPMAASLAPETTALEHLERLSALRASGNLDDKEFTAMKSAIISQSIGRQR